MVCFREVISFWKSSNDLESFLEEFQNKRKKSVYERFCHSIKNSWHWNKIQIQNWIRAEEFLLRLIKLLSHIVFLHYRPPMLLPSLESCKYKNSGWRCFLYLSNSRQTSKHLAFVSSQWKSKTPLTMPLSIHLPNLQIITLLACFDHQTVLQDHLYSISKHLLEVINSPHETFS